MKHQDLEVDNVENLFYNNSNLPEKFLNEIKSFASRNFLIVKEKETLRFFVCEKCFKAHAIRKLKEFEIATSTLYFINKKLRCKIGHNGYYLDEENVIEIL